MPLISSFISSAITQGLVESSEQSLTWTTTGGSSAAFSVNINAMDFKQLTNPNSYKFIKITAVQWTNGTVANGNIIAGVYIVDGTTPSSANIQLVAATASTAQTGTSTTQKANTIWSHAIFGTPVLGIGLITNGATSTMSFLSAQPNVNRQKAFTFPTTGFMPSVDTVAWSANTVYLADLTLFYKGYT